MDEKLESLMQALDKVRVEDRVRQYTASHVNERIDLRTAAAVQASVEAGRHAIVARLEQLNREWSIDRALMANFAILGGVTQELGRRYRSWRWVFRGQQVFLLMHAVVGWCPPLPVFRRLGVRTAKEIAAERAVLLAQLEALDLVDPNLAE